MDERCSDALSTSGRTPSALWLPATRHSTARFLGRDVARGPGSAAHDLPSGDSITTEEKHGLGGSASTLSDISGPLTQVLEMTRL
jgi:hypothetical protein